MSTVIDVPVHLITPHATNVRKDLGDLAELAASIKGMGVLQPLTVAPQGGDYVLIAGHRRHAAAVKAGVATVPCVVRPDLDTTAKQLQAMLVENLQRSDLTVMEEADAYAQLELLGVKEAAIAKTTGRSKATVHQRLQLAALPNERREQIANGKLTIETGVQCAKLRAEYADDAEILALIDKAATWEFATDYGLTYKIQRLLDARNPQPEDDDEDAIDYSGTRAEREAEWEKQRQERQARQEALAALRNRAFDWLSQRLVARDASVVDGLIDWALDRIQTDYEVDSWLPLVGIEPCGDDEDFDDAALRIDRALMALPREDKVLALALSLTPVSDTYLYDLRGYAQRMAALGYRLSKDDHALIDGGNE